MRLTGSFQTTTTQGTSAATRSSSAGRSTSVGAGAVIVSAGTSVIVAPCGVARLAWTWLRPDARNRRARGTEARRSGRPIRPVLRGRGQNPVGDAARDVARLLLLAHLRREDDQRRDVGGNGPLQ